MQKPVPHRRLISESEPEPSPEITVGAVVYRAGGYGPSGEVIAMTRSGRAVVRWHVSTSVTTLNAPSELVLIESPEREETEDECDE